MKPVFSVIVCTYNGGELLKKCLDSILTQSQYRIEVLCVDGGSTDNTLSYLRNLSGRDHRVKLIMNRLRLPEGKGYGKWLAYRKAKGRIVAFIDQDNILQSRSVFSNVEKVFSKEKKIAGVLGGLSHDMEDATVVRYVSLVGTDSFMAYRSADFLRTIGLSRKTRAGYELLPLKRYPLTITGGNCFFYLRSNLQINGAYDQDILVMDRLEKAGFSKVAIIPDATKHYTEKNLWRLATKKLNWGKSYFRRRKIQQYNYFPSNHIELKDFITNLLFNILILPNLYYSVRLWNKSRDIVSFLFPIHAFATTLAYGIWFLASKFNVLLLKS